MNFDGIELHPIFLKTLMDFQSVLHISMAESSEKQNFVGEKNKSHGATRHCSYGTCNSDSRYSDSERCLLDVKVFFDKVF
jgi:hypothetical protein